MNCPSKGLYKYCVSLCICDVNGFGVGIGAFLLKMGGNVVYFGVFLNVNWDRVRDLGISVCVVSVRQAEASCTLSVLCSCGLLALILFSLSFNIRFYLSDLCCCFVQ